MLAFRWGSPSIKSRPQPRTGRSFHSNGAGNAGSGCGADSRRGSGRWRLWLLGGNVSIASGHLSLMIRSQKRTCGKGNFGKSKLDMFGSKVPTSGPLSASIKPAPRPTPFVGMLYGTWFSAWIWNIAPKYQILLCIYCIAADRWNWMLGFMLYYYHTELSSLAQSVRRMSQANSRRCLWLTRRNSKTVFC